MPSIILPTKAQSDSIIDSIGTYADKYPIETLFGRHTSLYEHIHMPCKVYPSLDDDITVIAGDAAAWTLGSFVMAINAVDNTAPFDIHYVNVSNMDTNGIYQLIFYTVEDDAFASPVEIGAIRVNRNTNQIRVQGAPIQVPILGIGQRIAAKVAHSAAALAELTFSVQGHQYNA